MSVFVGLSFSYAAMNRLTNDGYDHYTGIVLGTEQGSDKKAKVIREKPRQRFVKNNNSVASKA